MIRIRFGEGTSSRRTAGEVEKEIGMKRDYGYLQAYLKEYIMEARGVGPALQEGVLEAIRNEGHRRRRAQAQGEWGMEHRQREEGYLVTGEGGHPEREEIGWDEKMPLKGKPGEREREDPHNKREQCNGMREERRRREEDNNGNGERSGLWTNTENRDGGRWGTATKYSVEEPQVCLNSHARTLWRCLQPVAVVGSLSLLVRPLSASCPGSSAS